MVFATQLLTRNQNFEKSLPIFVKLRIKKKKTSEEAVNCPFCYTLNRKRVNTRIKQIKLKKKTSY